MVTSIFVICQSISAQPVETLEIQGETFSVDHMGNVFWSHNQTLYKYQTGTGEKYEYTDNSSGSIHSFDVSNPLKILVYHKAFNLIVFLDNNLSPIRSAVNLNEMGLNNTGACCISHSGGFWLLNTTLNQIQHYSSNLQSTQETPVIKELRDTQDQTPQLIEKNRQLYCHLPDCCTLVFDRFGNLVNRYPLKNVDNIQILNENIYYFYKGTLNRIVGKKGENEKVGLPKKDNYWDDGKISRKRLYLRKNQTIYIYNR
ncbi:MAG: hypothetical protein ACLFM7_02550 [Bacteroidales bacterium]